MGACSINAFCLLSKKITNPRNDEDEVENEDEAEDCRMKTDDQGCGKKLVLFEAHIRTSV